MTLALRYWEEEPTVRMSEIRKPPACAGRLLLRFWTYDMFSRARIVNRDGILHLACYTRFWTAATKIRSEYGYVLPFGNRKTGHKERLRHRTR